MGRLAQNSSYGRKDVFCIVVHDTKGGAEGCEEAYRLWFPESDLANATEIVSFQQRVQGYIH